MGQLDSAATWLRTAERLAEGARLEAPAYMFGPWELSYLPLAPGDTLSRRTTATIDGTSDKLSFISYNASIIHAMRGDFAAADAAVARARSPGRGVGTRCFIAASMR